MDTHKEQIDKLEQAIFEGNHTAPDFTPAPEWKDRVMSAISEEIIPTDKIVTLMDFTPGIWRFSLAASLLAVCLGCYLFYTGLLPDYELVALFLSDPAGFFTSQPIGV